MIVIATPPHEQAVRARPPLGAPRAPARPGAADRRPACLITNTVTDYRREPFRMLAASEGVEVLAYAEAGSPPEAGPHPEVGSPPEAGSPPEGPPLRRVTQAHAARLAGSGRYRAVICGLGGRLALPGAYLGARRAGIPFVLWASIWAHPRTPAHLLSYVPTVYLYRRADAVVTYGPHVSAYVARRRGGRGNVFEAPQAVSAEHFGAPVPAEDRALARERAGAGEEDLLVVFVGRLEHEKGVGVLLDAWRRAALGPRARLAFAGEGPLQPLIADAALADGVAADGVAADATGAGRVDRVVADTPLADTPGADTPGADTAGRIRAIGTIPQSGLPALYAAADVSVLPSIRTATFREPWGLVVNEAMHQGTPVIATDAVGAVAGGLVRHRRNGLVAPAGDADALAACLRAVASDASLRARLGAAARRDVAAFSHEAWARGMSRALAAVGASRTLDTEGRSHAPAA